MKKNHLLALASLMLSTFAVQAQNTITSSWAYHDARFEGKSFRLFQPLKNQCFNFGTNSTNPTRLVSKACSTSDVEEADYRLQYVNGTIRTMKSFANTTDGGQKCLTYIGEFAPVSFESCNGKDEQQFRIAKMVTSDPHFSSIEDRFVIQSKSRGDCLTNTGMGKETSMRSCINAVQHGDYYLYELVDVTEPVRVRLVNRAWFNMSFETTYNSALWDPAWQALNQIRERALPTYVHTGISASPLKIDTSFGCSQTFNAEPGDNYEATAHGTTIKRWLIADKTSTTPQLKIYSGYDYNSANGSRYISDSVPNLMNFNDNIQSYQIPAGWTVRFYEEPNYQGGYFTRTASSGQDNYIDMNIKSIKIISK